MIIKKNLKAQELKLAFLKLMQAVKNLSSALLKM